MINHETQQPAPKAPPGDAGSITSQWHACAVGTHVPELPSCGTGLWGRARFVLRELSDIWRHARFKDEER